MDSLPLMQWLLDIQEDDRYGKHTKDMFSNEKIRKKTHEHTWSSMGSAFFHLYGRYALLPLLQLFPCILHYLGHVTLLD